MIDTKYIREKILDLAVRGKLVDQDPKDGDARDLLEEIQKEKEELIKAKTIKKEKKLPEIGEDEIPFEIPDSWVWVRLGKIVQVKGGKRVPKGKSLVNTNTGYKYIRVTDMRNGTILSDDIQYLDSNTYELIKNYTISSNDLYITVAGTIGRVGTIPFEFDGANLTENADKLVLFNNLNKIFIKYTLSSNYAQNLISSYSTKGSQPKLAIKNINNLIIPLPPLAEQERIVEKIEDAFELLDEIEAAQDQITSLGEQIKSKVLDMAIGGQLSEQNSSKEYIKPKVAVDNSEKYLNIPKHRTWIRVEDLGEIQTGNTPKKSQPENYGLELPFIKPSNINNLEMDYNTDEFLSDIGKKKGRIVEDNSILVTCIGNLGRAAIVDKEVAFNQQINSITPNEFVDSKLILYFITSNKFYNQMIKKSSTVTVRLLNKTSFSSIPFPLPPLGEQKRIVEKIEEIFAAVEAMIE